MLLVICSYNSKSQQTMVEILKLICRRVRGLTRSVYGTMVFLTIVQVVYTAISLRYIYRFGTEESAGTVTSNHRQLRQQNQETTPVYLITGAAGYIGSHMALALLDQGEHVVGVDNLSRGSMHAISALSRFGKAFAFENADIGDALQLSRIFRKYANVRNVLHFAGVAFVVESFQNPELYYRNITDNTKLLVDKMIEYSVPSLVYSSTCAVYGAASSPLNENTPAKPTSPYGRAKLEAENYIRAKISTNFHASILRYFNVVGSDTQGRLKENPHASVSRYARLWTSCVSAALGEAPCVSLRNVQRNPVLGDGSPSRDFLHVEDLVRAHLAALKLNAIHSSEARLFNVGTGKPTSTIEFVESAERAIGRRIPVCYNYTRQQEFTEPDMVFADSEALWRATGWQPRFMDVESMLATAWQSRLNILRSHRGK